MEFATTTNSCGNSSTGTSLFLWNPSTREYKLLPQPLYTDVERADTSKKHRASMYNYGVAYNGIIDDYKIIRIDVFYNNAANICYGCRVNVYTLRSDLWEWKALPNIILYDLFLSRPDRTKPVLVNGSLHWLGTPVKRQGLKTDSRLGEILLHNGKAIFTEVSPSNDIFLGSLDGCLCVLGGFKTHIDISNIEIWIMKDYGVRDSWTTDISVATHCVERPINMLPGMKFIDFVNDEVLFMSDVKNAVSILMYDPKHETSRLVRIQGISIKHPQVNGSELETCVESLVSLNSSTGLATKKRKDQDESMSQQRRGKAKKADI
ncbi:hypothetical protein MKX03_015871 [Papaver bracteatum]|nr:hypothetical protein MKX03_015871 [Papaver bracteatum]